MQKNRGVLTLLLIFMEFFPLAKKQGGVNTLGVRILRKTVRNRHFKHLTEKMMEIQDILRDMEQKMKEEKKREKRAGPSLIWRGRRENRTPPGSVTFFAFRLFSPPGNMTN